TAETSLGSALYSLARFLEPGELRELAEEAARGPGGAAVAHNLASYLGKEKEAGAAGAAPGAAGAEARPGAPALPDPAPAGPRAPPLLDPAGPRRLPAGAARRRAAARPQSGAPGGGFLLAAGRGARAGLLGPAGGEEPPASLVDVFFPPREFPTRPRLLGVL